MRNKYQMKNENSIVLTLLIFTFSFFFCLSCDTFVEPPEIHTPMSGYGRISVSLTAGEAAAPLMARTTFPSSAFNRYVYTFTKEGGTAEVKAPDGGYFTLEVGSYTVAVRAFIGTGGTETLAASGASSAFSVGPGENEPVEVLLTAVGTGTQGKFTYTITYPGDITTVDIALYKLPGLGEEDTDPEALDEGNGVTETLDLDTGFYLLTVYVSKSGQYAGLSEVIHIYPSLATVYEKNFVAADLVNNQLTVAFNLNGGTGTTPTAATGNNPGDVIALPDGDGLTKTGYTFGGWNAAAGGTGTTHAAGSSYTVTGNITLYVKWNPITYTVAYNKNAVNATGTTANSTHTYDVAQNLTANGFTYAAHTFNVWNTQIDGQGVAFIDEDSVFNLASTVSTITLYAQWVPDYIVTFNKNGGDTEADPNTKTVIHPATTVDSLPAPPTRAAHTFTGWNTQADGTGAAFTEADTVNANITVYAQWVPDYIVTFNNNGGNTEANPQTKTVIHPATTVDSLPAPPIRTNSAFNGWNTQANGSGDVFTAATMVTGDITVYAQWVSGVTVTFDRNGGSTEANPRTITVVSGTSIASIGGSLPAPPTRTGYAFIGWNMQAAGQGAAFTADTTVTGNITVYAQWVSE